MKQVSLNSVISSYPVPGTVSVTTVFVTSVTLTVYTNYYSVLIMYNSV